VHSAYVGPVGVDPEGARVLAELAANGVDVASAPVLEGVSTAVTEIVLLEVARGDSSARRTRSSARTSLTPPRER
jgi:uncharacterized protein (DUF2336 family)